MAEPSAASGPARAAIVRPARIRSSAARRVIAALFAAMVLCFALPSLAAGRALPPGQEELFAEILGRGVALPGGCVWAGASIRGGLVTSQYDCGPAKARVEIELRDRASPPRGATLTRELAITVAKGDAPPGLLDAIAERVRAREPQIRWIELSGPVTQRDGSTGLLPMGLMPRLAWLLVAIWLAARGALLVARAARGRVAWRGSDAPTFAIVTALALALRLAVPWGPMDFAEPERVAPLWSAAPRITLTFESFGSLLQLLRAIGLGIEPLYRWAGPLSGALGVGFALLFARESGLRARAAVLAAAILLVWPAHVRYSASAGLTIVGPTIWLAALVVAITPRLTMTWKIPLLVPLVVLGVYTRPEYRLLVVALAPLVFTASWTWRARLVLLALLSIALGPYVLAHGRPESGTGYSAGWRHFFVWTLRDASIGPAWWMLLGLAGLAAGRLDRAPRASLILATGLLLLGYGAFASENNPLWGQWRYLVSIAPFLAISAAAMVDRLPRISRERPMEILVAATLLSVLIHRRVLVRPLDYQAEFAYVRESAPRLAAKLPNLVVLVDEREHTGGGVNAEMNAVMAISFVLGASADPSSSALVQPAPGAPRVWSHMVLLEAPNVAPDKPRPGPDDSALFLGLRRTPEVLAPLIARYDLAPIEERIVYAAEMVPVVGGRCKREMMEVVGASLPDCPLSFGWYRLVPRTKQ